MKKALLRTGVLAATCTVLAAVPTAGQAQTFSFVNPTNTRMPGTYIGPATPYPSSINVAGLSGTVTKATVLLIDVEAGGTPDKLDLVLAGPNGAKVLLWSDACGAAPLDDLEFIFDDAAGTFLSDGGPCPAGTYLPSNYLGAMATEPDTLGGNPAPPYTNSLSAFNGISPNGAWNLFAYSDSNEAFFDIAAWALTLQIQPPPAAPAAAAQTGLRAAALKKCKKKRGKKARKKCKRKAQKLPL